MIFLHHENTVFSGVLIFLFLFLRGGHRSAISLYDNLFLL